MSEPYYSMKSLMEPEGWPSAKTRKSHQGVCNQPIKNKERGKRLVWYQKLVEMGIPLPDKREYE